MAPDPPVYLNPKVTGSLILPPATIPLHTHGVRGGLRYVEAPGHVGVGGAGQDGMNPKGVIFVSNMQESVRQLLSQPNDIRY